MATGSLVSQVCYETSQEAANAYYTGLPSVTSTTPAGLTYETSYVQLNGVWTKQQTVTDTFGVTTVLYTMTAVPPPFPACFAPSEQYLDGMTFGFMVIPLLMMPWFASLIKKALI